MHLCIDCICIHAYSSSQASQQGGGGGKDAAKEGAKDGTQHGQGRHRSDGRDARQHRQGCRRSLVSTLQKQAAMNRPNNGSEGWQLTRVCSVKHQKQLSGRQGSWSEKHLRKGPYRASSAERSNLDRIRSEERR